MKTLKKTLLLVTFITCPLNSLYAMNSGASTDPFRCMIKALKKDIKKRDNERYQILDGLSKDALDAEPEVIQLATPPAGREADITQLLKQESGDILTLNKAAIDRGLPEVCSWPQLHKLTFMLSKACLHQVSAINFESDRQDRDLPTLPKNPILRKLWEENAPKFKYDKGNYWLPALWATTYSLKNVQPSQEATEVPVHLHTLLAFFDSFAPVSTTRCEDIKTTDPHVATHYTGVCFKRLYDLAQLTECKKKSQKRKYSDIDEKNQRERQFQKQVRMEIAEEYMAQMFTRQNDYSIQIYRTLSTNVPLEEHKYLPDD